MKGGFATPHRPAVPMPSLGSKRPAMLAAGMACCLALGPLPAQTGTPGRGMGEILDLQGKVSWSKLTTAWEPAAIGQPLLTGDGINTADASLATIQLPRGSFAKVAELTTFRVQESPAATSGLVAALTRGKVFFFSRIKPAEVAFSTPEATGNLEGTEILIRIDPNGVSSFVVLEGSLVLTPNGNTANITRVGRLERADVQKNGQVVKTAVLDVVAPMQWAIYYPAILDPAMAEPAESSPWRSSWLAYKRGALPAAIQALPAGSSPQTPAERLLAAALGLANGRPELVDIQALDTEPARALRLLATVAARGAAASDVKTFVPESATGWLAVSYARQSTGDLAAALEAARRAAHAPHPASGYAWARLGELEFAFGRRAAAAEALTNARHATPDLASALAVRGFVAAADARLAEAEENFNQALRLDLALAPARMGLGILAHGRGDAERGRQELIAAAALNPMESLPRSYLAKAWLRAGDMARATTELEIATRLDKSDPTPALYSALVAERENRPNAAVADLERSVALNHNRRVFRSRLLLDSDLAVRRANLAALYDWAGGKEIALREASRAVRDDPGNFSAHLFLAHAYDLQRDPLRINLRYETPWSGSLLLARLLAPAGVGALAPSVGLGEYTGLFEPPRFSLQGETVYLDTGEWRNTLVQTGNFGRTNYALEARTHRFPGWRTNQDFARHEFTALAAHQITPDDTVSIQAYLQRAHGGDLRVGIPPEAVSLQSRFREREEPLGSVGYRHHWRPGSDTLMLAARLESDLEQANPTEYQTVLAQEPDGRLTPFVSLPLASTFGNHFHLYQFEAAHLEQGETWSGQAGARWQRGTFEGTTRMIPPPGVPVGLFANPAVDARVREPFYRASLYAYGTWRFAPGWSALAGMTSDWMGFPMNLYTQPITAGHARKSRVSPRAGLVWEPGERWSVRAAHAESVGGISFEESFRLEPVQFAGFTQGVRSLIPEAVGGSTVAPEFDLDGIGVTAKWAGRFYLDFEAQLRRSEATRFPGVFVVPPTPARPRSIREELAFRERQVSLSAWWIVSERWSATFGIDWLDVRLQQEAANAPDVRLLQRSRLLAPKLRLSWNSPHGYFGQTESSWLRSHSEIELLQSSARHVWNTRLTVGYRARSLKWTAAIGVENLWNSDLALDALTMPFPLPPQRAFFARLTWAY